MCEKPARDLLDAYSPIAIGNILPTSTKSTKDVFTSLRPHRHKCVDYTISQTYARLQCRDTKINVKQTRATYVPITEEQLKEVLRKEREAKVIYCSGRPGQWKFVDEIWRDKQNNLQKQYKQGLKQFIKRRKTFGRNKAADEHGKILSLVGPEWYQELSPKQIRVVNQLTTCIANDREDATTINTQENMAMLGLVLRPNKGQIHKALHLSKGCPVEFLLVLYQLINPNRKQYSLNDRLLLSAVVHLTITETLRELHVRIPSPPRRVIIRNMPDFKQPKIKYESPYLEPLTMNPVPPKYTGIYTNKHLQYPESPYFSYLKYFRQNCFVGNVDELIYSDNLCFKERLLLLEYKKAQKFYDNLAGHKKMKQLLKPTILNMFEDDMDDGDLSMFNRIPSLIQVRDPDYNVYKCECGNLFPIYSEESAVKDPCCCGCKNKKLCTCREFAEKFYNSICRCQTCKDRRDKENVVCVISSIQDGATCDKILPVISGIARVKPCECFEAYRNRAVKIYAISNLLSNKETYAIQGMTLTNEGPAFNLTSICYPRRFCPIISEEYQQCLKDAQETLVNATRKHVICGIVHTINGPVYILSSVYKERDDTCTCFDLYKYKVTLKKAQKQLTESKAKYVIQGLTITSEGPMYILSGVTSLCVADGEQEPKQSCKIKCKFKNIKEKVCCLAEHTSSDRSRSSLSFSISPDLTLGSNSESFTSSNTSICPCTISSTSSSEFEFPSAPVICQKPSLRGDPIKPISIDKKESVQAVNGDVCKGCPKIHTQEEKDKNSSQGENYMNAETNRASDHDNNEKPLCLKPGNLNKANKKFNCCFKPVEEESQEDCRCLEKSKDNEGSSVYEDDGDEEKYSCKCNDALDLLLQNKCSCDICNADRRQKEATYILSGDLQTESGHFINILEGIRQMTCGCLHEHREKIRKMEEYKQRIKSRLEIMKQTTKYAIEGVQVTPEGPRYLLSGIRSPIDCDCAKAIRAKQEEEARLSQMAKMPDTGRIKYEITGVRQMEGENIYILNRALNIEECTCMKIVEQFEHQHKQCLIEYENFLKAMKDEAKIFSDEEKVEFPTNNTSFTAIESQSSNEERGEEETIKNTYNEEAVLGKNDAEEDGTTRCTCKRDSDTNNTKPKGNNSDTNKCSCIGNDKEFDSSSETSSTDTSSNEESSYCSKCKKESEFPDVPNSEEGEKTQCECILCQPIRKKTPVKPISIPPPKTPVDFESKRFFIYHKLPLSRKRQLQILKKALNSLAEDGFPLPKLPDCYKLPHFRLWMQMRCGVTWTQEDRWKYVKESYAMWNHSDICYSRIPLPKLPISLNKAKKLTWSDAKYVRRIIEEHHEKFYRKVKQTSVDSAREFFLPTFDYEFPREGFRDCYFAYFPTKEEEVISNSVPDHIEGINETRKYNCYC